MGKWYLLGVFLLCDCSNSSRVLVFPMHVRSLAVSVVRLTPPDGHSLHCTVQFIRIPCLLLKGHVDIAQTCLRNRYLNFTASIPREVLEEFAESVASHPDFSASNIKRIYDGYCNFVSLQSDLFTLDIPDSYSLLNDRNLKVRHTSISTLLAFVRFPSLN